MAKHHFPQVQGGGSLILAWQVKKKHVLVVGGGEVSTTLSSQAKTTMLTETRSQQDGSSICSMQMPSSQ